MKKINKYDDIIINHYNNYNEDERFSSNSGKVEYLTTLKYIKKYAKKGCKILEIGAGTGAYSIALAQMGFKVTAVELVPRNLEIMKEKAKGIENINCVLGDALNLSKFEDNSFDIVLNLGPMYHLYSQKDKNKAISESIRVCKQNGICMFAYLTHSSIVWEYGIKKNKMAELSKYLQKDGKITDTPNEIFSAYFIEDFNKQFNKTKTTFLKNVATDGIVRRVKEYIDAMTEKDYNRVLQWHFATCERADQQGLSSHMLYICRKNKEL